MMVHRDSTIELLLVSEVILNTGETDYLELNRKYNAAVLVALGIALQEDIIEEMFEELLQTVNQNTDVIAIQDMYLVSSVLDSKNAGDFDMFNMENTHILIPAGSNYISPKIQLIKKYLPT